MIEGQMEEERIWPTFTCGWASSDGTCASAPGRRAVGRGLPFFYAAAFSLCSVQSSAVEINVGHRPWLRK